MKLSEDTIAILKNFSSINPNLVIKPADKDKQTISTIAEAKNILASAEIAEVFPRELGIYDLGEFLSVLGLFDSDRDLDFSDSHVTVGSGSYRCDYHYADPSILTAPQKAITMPSADVEVTIPATILDQVRKAAGVLGHSSVSLQGKDGEITLTVLDPKVASSNRFSVTLDGDNACKSEFDLQFLISNLKILPGDYNVELSSKLISRWEHTQTPVEYYIALEKTSSFS